MASFSALETAKHGILAQKFGFDVTNNNIQNINTPGYSRRSAVLTETTPHRQGNGVYVGTGVAANSLRTYREELFDRDVRNAIGRQANFATEQSLLERVESLLAEPSEHGISESLNQFFASLEAVSNSPQSMNHRENVLQTAHTLIKNLHYTAGVFTNARKDIRHDIENDVVEINKLLNEIADLNKSIAYTKADAGIENQTYFDKREVALEKLAKLTGAHVTHEENGTANVFINGINVVTAAHASKLTLSENTNPATGESTLIINKIEPNGVQTGTVEPVSGELAARMKGYNVTFDPRDTSGAYSAYTSINQFVNTLTTRINALTETGYGLHDPAGAPPGRKFFIPAVGDINAHNIELNPDLDADAALIPFSATAGTVGDNTIARAMARIASDQNFLNNYNPSGSFNAVLSKVGMMAQEAINGNKTMGLVVQQLEGQRESLMGVNLDEEAVNIVKYQRAFEASSRVVNMTNEMLQTLIRMV